jgi:hypothetical protein
MELTSSTVIATRNSQWSPNKRRLLELKGTFALTFLLAPVDEPIEERKG